MLPGINVTTVVPGRIRTGSHLNELVGGRAPEKASWFRWARRCRAPSVPNALPQSPVPMIDRLTSMGAAAAERNNQNPGPDPALRPRDFDRSPGRRR